MSQSIVGRAIARNWTPARAMVASGLLLGLLLILWAAPGADAQSMKAKKVFAVTTADNLVTFNRATPEDIRKNVSIKGLESGERVVGMDFRPATGKLYAIGSTSQVYIINRKTGQTKPVGDGFTPPLAGNQFGVDFNPTVDRIRLVSNDEQNLRLNPATGEVGTDPATGNPTVDPPLQYAAGDENAGADPNVVAAAYTNNRAEATTTTLYDIDSNLDILVTQDPANDGTLNTVGSLGVNTNHLVGFDIAPGYGVLAAMKPERRDSSILYRIDLQTGDATRLGRIGTKANIKALASPVMP